MDELPQASLRSLKPPVVTFQGRSWASDELRALGESWLPRVLEATSSRPSLIAIVMVNHPRTIALFFALASIGAPLAVLQQDPRTWDCSPPLPDHTIIVLPPELSFLREEAGARGISTLVLDEPEAGRPSRRSGHSALAAGLILFTSGSTGNPKPVFKAMADILPSLVARRANLGLSMGSNILGTLPLDRAYGLKSGLLLPAVLEGRLGLVDGRDYGAIREHFASGEYDYWASTPAMVAPLVRSGGRRGVRAPTLSVTLGWLTRDLFDAFQGRFEMPLRGFYGTTEVGAATLDDSEKADVRACSVGRPTPGIELRIGDNPERPVAVGEIGRICIRSRWLAHTYGFTPDRSGRQDEEWWPSPDLGSIDGDGYLWLAGRQDDAVLSASGRLVHLHDLVTSLLLYPGVADAVAVPLVSPSGTAIGVLVESASAILPSDLRLHLSRSSPALPRVVEVMTALPRLADGRPDRVRCMEMLRERL